MKAAILASRRRAPNPARDPDTIPYAVDGKYTGIAYRYCAGYQYNDPTIVGFSHTHFSGTGHFDLGDFLIMPTK